MISICLLWRLFFCFSKQKTSRRGWQSPNQEIEISADNYAPVLKAKGSAQSVAPKSSHTLTVESAYSSTKATPAANNYLDSRYLTSTPTTMYQVKEVDRNLKVIKAGLFDFRNMIEWIIFLDRVDYWRFWWGFRN